MDYRTLRPSPSDSAAGFSALLVRALVSPYASRDKSSPGKTVKTQELLGNMGCASVSLVQVLGQERGHSVLPCWGGHSGNMISIQIRQEDLLGYMAR